MFIEEEHTYMYVCSGVENEMPLFNRIVSVIVRDDSAYLLTCTVSTMYFDDHLNAFSIEEKNNVITLGMCRSRPIRYNERIPNVNDQNWFPKTRRTGSLILFL